MTMAPTDDDAGGDEYDDVDANEEAYDGAGV